MRQRSIRLFLSSTFRDFGEERDLLVRQVFPALRARLKDRFVELVDVDLRWGITVEQAERGEVLPICLAEIDRARPYFIGMLGERYGWIPPPEGYAADLIERQPWLKKHQGGKSVTELEILHGVLNNRRMKGRAFFYFRSSAYAHAKGGDYLPTAEDRARQSELKHRIRQRGLPVTVYANPEALAKRLERDLWKLLNAEFPAAEVPDAFERERLRHETYAAPRRRLYLGGERYQAALEKLLAAEEPRIVVKGASGGGKSALLANFFEAYRKRHRRHLVHEHYLGASADAADPHALVHRLCEFIKRQTDSSEAIESDPQKLMDGLPFWLAAASVWARKRKTRFVFVLDALNSLTGQQDLRWWPAFLPQGVHFVVSCLTGPVLQALTGKAQGLDGQSPHWKLIDVKPLSKSERRSLLTTYLARFNKTLSKDLTAQVMAHPLSESPLFIRTLAEELRLFGMHEQLTERLAYYVESQTIDDLYEKVIERVEEDCGKKAVADALTAIWASRAGLTEQEILGIADLKPAEWAPIRNALEEALLESDGKITFAHDYMRIAVRDRYLATKAKQRAGHRRLAQWFEGQPVSARRAHEEPYQWNAAQSWRRLKACLVDRQMFEALSEHTSTQEIWNYWINIEQSTAARVEYCYESAWKRWNAANSEVPTGELAQVLARFLHRGGRFGRFVKSLFQKSLTIIRETEGPDTLAAGICLNNLALFLQGSGDYDEAEPMFEKALEIAENILGRYDPETGLRMNSLAGLLQDKGEYGRAESLFRQALEIAEKTKHAVGEDNLGFALNNLARLLGQLGQYDQALPLYQRALAIAERLHGPLYPITASRLDNIAQIMHERGDFDEAERLYKRALQIREQVLGPNHIETGITANNLAMLLYSQGEYRSAEELARRDLAILEATVGPDHPDTGISAGNLARILRKQGDLTGAEFLVRRALDIHQNSLGFAHPTTCVSLHRTIEVLIDQRKIEDAKKLARHAILMARSQGNTYPGIFASTLQYLGVALRDTGHLDDAEEFLLEGLKLIERVNGNHALEISPYLSAMGQLCFLQHRYLDALTFLRKCLDIRKAHLPVGDAQISIVEERIVETEKRIRDDALAAHPGATTDASKSIK